MNTTNALRQTDRQSTLVMDAKCSSLHKYAPPSWCFLGSVDRVAYLFGLPVDGTGPRGSVTWLRSASAASRRLPWRFFGADAAAWFAGVWCALVCYPGSTTSTTCGCVRLRAVGTGLVLSGCVWLSYGCTGGYSTVFLGYSTVIVRFLRNCPLWIRARGAPIIDLFSPKAARTGFFA